MRYSSTVGQGLLIGTVIIVTTTTVASMAVDHHQDYGHTRRILSRRLDSMEVLIQEVRRSGRPTASLDSEMIALHDSLTLLRYLMASDSNQQSGEEGTRASNEDNTNSLWRRWSMPISMIDWAIIAVGGVAMLSGIVLLITLLRSFFSRLPYRKKKYPRPAMASEKFGRSVSPDVQGTMAAKVPLAFEATPTASPNIEDRPITQLPKTFRPSSPLTYTNAGESVENKVSAQTIPQGEMIDAVRKEAARGFSTIEISKKFRMSVDQVELLLRLARKKSATNSDM